MFGAETVFVSDIDTGPCKILAHRFPGVPNLGDISAIDWSPWAGKIDILEGGSPCPDLSTAGRRAGMTDGTRSNLWVMMRHAIAEIRPRFVVWENVRGAYSATATSAMESDPGLLGDHPAGQPALRALGRVLGDLADLGYDAQWCGLRAADVGAAHARFRVFLLATRQDAADADLPRLEGQRDPAGTSPAERHGHALTRPGGPDLTLLPTPTSNLGSNGGPQDPAKRRAGGHSVSIEDVVHGLKLLPTPTATPYGSNQSMSGGAAVRPSLDGVVKLLPTPRATNMENRQSDRFNGERGNYHGLLTGAIDWQGYAPAIARQEQAFGRPCPPPAKLNTKGNPKLSPRLIEWLMGLPDGWVTDVPDITDNEASKALGNGVVPQQCVAALHHMLTNTAH